MYQIIIIIHVLLGLSVIGFVIVQHGKGADAGAAFGSASSGSVFGAQGSSSFLSRTTAILAALFFATSLGLAILSSYQEGEIDLINASSTEEGEVVADVPLIDSADNEAVVDGIPAVNPAADGADQHPQPAQVIIPEVNQPEAEVVIPDPNQLEAEVIIPDNNQTEAEVVIPDNNQLEAEVIIPDDNKTGVETVIPE